MADVVARGALAVIAALGLGAALVLLPLPRRIPRDAILAGYAVTVAVLGLFAIFGGQAALVGAAAIGAAVVLGGLIYGLVALGGRWAERE